MNIRMVEERTGGRHDGRAWPPVGGEIDVDDDEGAAIVSAGWAVPVPEKRAETGEEKRAATEETRTASPKKAAKQG